MRRFVLAIFFLLVVVSSAHAQLSTCTISGGPFDNGLGGFDTSIRIRVRTVAGYVSGSFIRASDVTYLPDRITGIVSFSRARGSTIIVNSNDHPSFQNPVTLVVPDEATYDLNLIANLSVAAPPATLGFTIKGLASDFRASTFNISGTGVALTESPSGQANLVITAGGGIGFSGSLTSGGVMLGDGITSARASSKWTMDSNGRLSLASYTAAYDQEANTLSYAHLIDVGSQAVNSSTVSKQLDALRITGTLTGSPTASSHAYLDGLNFDMEVTGNPSGSSETDPVQLRGIRGEFRNNSSTGASVRGMNLHARAMTGATGLVNAAAFGVTSVSATGTDLARALQLTSKGVTDKNIGIYFEQDSGINYKVGIDFSNALYSVGALKFASGQSALVGRNAANNADIAFLSWSSADRAQFAVPITSIAADAFVQVGSNDTGWLFQIVDSDGRIRLFKQGTGELFTITAGGMVQNPGVAFGNLGTPSSGTFVYCTNCAPASSPCTGSSTGAWAFRQSSVWRCL